MTGRLELAKWEKTTTRLGPNDRLLVCAGVPLSEVPLTELMVQKPTAEEVAHLLIGDTERRAAVAFVGNPA